MQKMTGMNNKQIRMSILNSLKNLEWLGYGCYGYWVWFIFFLFLCSGCICNALSLSCRGCRGQIRFRRTGGTAGCRQWLRLLSRRSPDESPQTRTEVPPTEEGLSFRQLLLVFSFFHPFRFSFSLLWIWIGILARHVNSWLGCKTSVAN